MNVKKPPLGLIPNFVWVQYRIEEIVDAIDRYIDAELPVPIIWIEEYNSLVKEVDTK